MCVCVCVCLCVCVCMLCACEANHKFFLPPWTLQGKRNKKRRKSVCLWGSWRIHQAQKKKKKKNEEEKRKQQNIHNLKVTGYFKPLLSFCWVLWQVYVCVCVHVSVFCTWNHTKLELFCLSWQQSEEHFCKRTRISHVWSLLSYWLYRIILCRQLLLRPASKVKTWLKELR